MSCIDEASTKKSNEKHWGDFKLISKSVGIPESRKTKSMIVEASIDSSKFSHQRRNNTKHLKIRMERNENSNFGEEVIISVIRHGSKKEIFPLH